MVCLICLPFIEFGLDLIVKSYLTKFKAGLPIYLIAIFSGVLRAGAGLFKDFYMARDVENKYSMILIIMVVFNIVVYGTLHYYGTSLNEFIYYIAALDFILFTILLTVLLKWNFKFVSSIYFVVLSTFTLIYVYNFWILKMVFLSREYIMYNALYITFCLGLGGLLFFLKREQLKRLVKN